MSMPHRSVEQETDYRDKTTCIDMRRTFAFCATKDALSVMVLQARTVQAVQTDISSGLRNRYVPKTAP